MSKAEEAKQGQGPMYFLNIEGKEYPWSKDTVTTEEIAELGGWDVSNGVIEVDKDNNEHTLQPGEVVEIKPGHGFGKKHLWKRGDVRPRISAELQVLRAHWSDVEHAQVDGDDWFKIVNYPLPSGWQLGDKKVETSSVVFLATAAHPGSAPYAFMTPNSLNYGGSAPNNTGAPSKPPPFEGNWMQFSWNAEQWEASSDVHKGSNLLAWSKSFGHRFRQGV